MVNWFSTKDVDALADSIIAELRERFPQGGSDLSTRKSAEKAMKALERMAGDVTRFAAQHRPNMYQKARFGNRIKWALKDAGYPVPFIDVVTHEFVKQLTLSASRHGRKR
jgi:hypothetical protein